MVNVTNRHIRCALLLSAVGGPVPWFPRGCLYSDLATYFIVIAPDRYCGKCGLSLTFGAALLLLL